MEQFNTHDKKISLQSLIFGFDLLSLQSASVQLFLLLFAWHAHCRSSLGCGETPVLVPSQCALKSTLSSQLGRCDVLIKAPHQGGENCSRHPSHFQRSYSESIICCSSLGSAHLASSTISQIFSTRLAHCFCQLYFSL